MKRSVVLGLAVFLLVMCLPLPLHAQKGPVNALTSLPQDHECQKVLRQFMGTLTENDLAHGVAGTMQETKAAELDAESLYRTHIYTLMIQPLVGMKRGMPVVNAPPACFLLSNIERKDAVYFPPIWPETLMSFVQWNHPSNPFYNNKALKLRAFVGATVQMVMFLNFAELNDSKVPPPIRPDWHGYNAVIWAAPYPGFKDALPPLVQKAYEDCLRLCGERILKWGIRGETCENDLTAPLGLVYISRALNDPEFTKKVEAHVRPIFTEPKFIHPAGYWVERGGIETGFAGQANLYAAWIALMTDWPFAKEVLERNYRLRGHLILPEPDGRLTGPSHFNTRLGSPPCDDQFAWDGVREIAASMVTDEAMHFVPTPTLDALKEAPHTRAHQFDEHLRENTRDNKGHYYTNSELTIENSMSPWKLKLWMTFNFPISVNPAYEFYKQGAFAHRQELAKKNSPLLKSPYLRGETFIRDFEKAFVCTRQPGFAAILHTGRIGAQKPDDGKAQFGGPMGLSGGQLSVFWTPGTGSVILGLRSGMSYDKTFDDIKDWRLWPNHSVSGVTVDGKVFSSARIVAPEVTTQITGNTATVKAGGVLPTINMVTPPVAEGQKPQTFCYDGALDGKLDYARTFKIDDKGVSVETSVDGDGKDNLAELYEVIPVYLRDADKQAKATPTAIEFQTAGKWGPATDKYTESVHAVRLTRFDGAVTITFDAPQRVRLSPADWADQFLTRATSRNLMIDLLSNGDKPTSVKGVRKVSYRIQPAAK